MISHETHPFAYNAANRYEMGNGGGFRREPEIRDRELVRSDLKAANLNPQASSAAC